MRRQIERIARRTVADRAAQPEEMVIEGIRTNIALHQELIRQNDVVNGDYSIKWLEEWLAKRGG